MLLFVLQYACKDAAVARQSLYENTVRLHGRVLDLLAKKLHQLKASHLRVKCLEAEVKRLHREKVKLAEDVEVMQTCASLLSDGK